MNAQPLSNTIEYNLLNNKGPRNNIEVVGAYAEIIKSLCGSTILCAEQMQALNKMGFLFERSLA